MIQHPGVAELEYILKCTPRLANGTEKRRVPFLWRLDGREAWRSRGLIMLGSGCFPSSCCCSPVAWLLPRLELGLRPGQA